MIKTKQSFQRPQLHSCSICMLIKNAARHEGFAAEKSDDRDSIGAKGNGAIINPEGIALSEFNQYDFADFLDILDSVTIPIALTCCPCGDTAVTFTI